MQTFILHLTVAQNLESPFYDQKKPVLLLNFYALRTQNSRKTQELVLKNFLRLIDNFSVIA